MVKMYLFSLANPIDFLTKSLQLDVAIELATEGIISRWLEKKNFTPALILGFDIPFSPHRERLFRRRNVEEILQRNFTGNLPMTF